MNDLSCLMAAETLCHSLQDSPLPYCYLQPCSHRPSFPSHRAALLPVRQAVDNNRPDWANLELLSSANHLPTENNLWTPIETVGCETRGPIGARNTWFHRRRLQRGERKRSVRPQMTRSCHSGIGYEWEQMIVAQTKTARDSQHQRSARHYCQTSCMLQAYRRGRELAADTRPEVDGTGALYRGGHPTGGLCVASNVVQATKQSRVAHPH